MKTVKKLFSLTTVLLLCIVSFSSCKKDKETPIPIPTISLENGEATASSISFKVKAVTNADRTAYNYIEKGSTELTNDAVLKNGKVIPVNYKDFIVIPNLKPSTTYIVYVVAQGKGGIKQSTIEMQTKKEEETIVDDPEQILFNAATAENFDGKNYGLVFKSDKGEELNIDAYCDLYKYLREGVYNVGGETAPYIGSEIEYSYLKVGEEKVGIKSGTMDVKVNMEAKIYNIAFDMILANDKPLKAKYEGAIEGSPIFDEATFKLDAAKRLTVDKQIPGQFYIKLNDNAYTYEVSLNFYAEASNVELPEGTYKLGETTNPNTLGNNSMISCYNLKGVPGGKIKSGEVVVTKKDNIYNFDIKVTDVNDQKFVGTYEGEIADMISKTKFTKAVAEVYSSDNYALEFTTEAGEKLALDTYFDSYKYLPEGEYVVGKKSKPNIETDAQYTYFKAAGTEKSIAVKSGKMIVKVNNSQKTYAIDFDLILEDDKEVKAVYEGEIENSPIFDEATFKLTSASKFDIDKPIAGQYYIKLNDDKPNYEISLNFYADPNSSELPAGTYTFGTGTSAGTLGDNSSLSCYITGMPDGKLKSGKVVVTKNGDDYKLDIDLTNASDQRFVGTYEGKIANMSNKLVFTTAQAEKYSKSNYSMTFKSKAGDILNLDTYFDAYKYIREGKYIIGGSSNPKIDTDISYTNYRAAGTSKNVELKSGTVDIKIDLTKKIYIINFDIVLADNSPLKAKYEGAIPGSDIFDEMTITLNNARRFANNNAVAGEYYVKLNETNYKFDMVIDFFTNNTDTNFYVLFDGDYSFNENKTAPCIGPKTEISCSLDQPVTGGKITSGKVNVKRVSGNNYVLTIDVTDASGQRFVGKYEGEIKNMDLAQN